MLTNAIFDKYEKKKMKYKISVSDTVIHWRQATAAGEERHHTGTMSTRIVSTPTLSF